MYAHTHTHTHTHSLRAVPELKQSWVLARRPHWLLPASSPLLLLLPTAKGVYTHTHTHTHRHRLNQEVQSGMAGEELQGDEDG